MGNCNFHVDIQRKLEGKSSENAGNCSCNTDIHNILIVYNKNLCHKKIGGKEIYG